jgi:hypothetical protein
MVGIDFGTRTYVFSEPFFATEDESGDKQKIVTFFKAFKGYIPEFGISEDIEC